MTEAFILDGVSCEIEVSIDRTTFKIPDASGNKLVYDFDTVMNSKKFQESQYYFDTYTENSLGDEVANSRVRRAFKRIIGRDEFRALYALNLTSEQLGRAILNGLVSWVTNVLSTQGEFGVKPFDPASGFLYAEPIDWTIQGTDETAEGSGDGQIQATIGNQFGTNSPEFKVTKVSDNSIVQDWNTNLSVSGLSPDTYKCEVRLSDDFGEGTATAIGRVYEVQIN